MFIRNCWYVAAWADELGTDKPDATGAVAPSRPLPVTVIGEPLVLFRGASGQLVA